MHGISLSLSLYARGISSLAIVREGEGSITRYLTRLVDGPHSKMKNSGRPDN